MSLQNLPKISRQAQQLIEEQQYQEASNLLQNRLSLLQESSLTVQQRKLIAEMYGQWGFCNYFLGEYKEGIAHFEKAIQIYEQVHKAATEKTADCFNDMGTCYGRLGDYEQELNCYEKALTIRLQLTNLDSESLVESYHNIGHVHGQNKQYDKQLTYLHKALDLSLQQIERSDPELAFSYHSMGWAYHFLEQNEKAAFYHNKALELRENTLAKDHILLAQSHNHLAWLKFNLENYKSAIEHHQKALTIRLQHFGALHEDCIISNHGIAKCYQRLGKYEQALQQLQDCLQKLVPDFEANDLSQNPSLQSYTFPLRLYECLRDKAWCFHLQYQNTTRDLQSLQLAFETYLLTTQLIDRIRNSYQGEGSKLMLAEETTWLFEHAIEAAVNLYEATQKEGYLEAAFTFSEKSKSLLLLSSLKDAAAKIAVSIPSELLQKEQILRKQLTEFDRQIVARQVALEHQQTPNWMVDAALRTLQGKHFDLLQTYNHFIQQLENDYPDYYQLKYEVATVPLKEVEEHLNSNVCLLSYFVGKKKIYIFEVYSKENATNQTSMVHHFDKPDDFEEVLEEFVEAIEDMSRKSFIRKSFQLYEWLIEATSIERNDIAVESENDVQNLIIIPHAQLSQIPFEALITQKVFSQTAYKDLPYLLQQFDISYHYSATLLCHALALPSISLSNREISSISDNSFVGFAPIYSQLKPKDLIGFESLTQLELIYTEKEMQSIEQLFENQGFTAKTYCHLEASKAQFLAAIGEQKYIHIAAHGLVNPQQMALSGILLSPENASESLETGMLYIGESYNLDLSADLVVLSCCESGVGKLASGEGMMAINRGFLYAGAKNVIFTIFKVYDEESALLTKHLYEGILEGMSVTEALSNAKRKLIADEAIEAMPILWSGYVLIGV